MWSMRNGSREWRGGEEVTSVGREAASDLQLGEDASVSRRHASLRVELGQLVLRDEGSRYGTWVVRKGSEPRRIKSKTDEELEDGDVVRFGALKNAWNVTKLRPVTCYSTKIAAKEELTSMLSEMGVRIRDEWNDECTHLTMSAVSLSMKTVLALIDCRPIVSPDFWKAYIGNFRNNLTLPDPIDYLPPINEPTLNPQTVDFSPNENRKQIFRGKTIVFLSQDQYTNYKTLIEKTRGTPLYLDKNRITKNQLLNPKCIVILSPNDEQSQAVITILKEKNLRAIPEPEIALAILHCSLDKYCNPLFKFTLDIIDTNMANKSTEILVPETQCLTVDDDADFLPNPRKTSRHSDEHVPCKRMKIVDIPESIESRTQNRPSTLDDLQFNIKKPKQKNYNDGNDDDLFNFVSYAPSTSAFDSKLKRSLDDDFICPSTKKFRPDPTLSDSSSSMTELKHNISEIFTNSRWMSRREPSSLISVKKEEKPMIDLNDEMLEGFSNIKLQPAVVVVNNNLIKKREAIDVPDGDRSVVVNFKKFTKVKPLNPPSEVIPRRNLRVHEGVSKNYYNFADVDSDEDGRNVSLFDMPDKPVSKVNGKSRRL